MKLVVMNFPHAFSFFLPLRFKYLSQHSRFVLLRTCNAGDRIKHSGRGGEKKKCILSFFGGEARRKELLARSRCSKEGNIKINFKETEWGGVYWIGVA